MMDRRQFLEAALAAVSVSKAAGETTPWPSPVLDIHLHPRHGDDREADHLQGAGIARAVLLPSLGSEERTRKLCVESPKQFARFANADVRLPESIQKLRAQLTGGAIGMGELKYPVDIDGPEMRRVYDLAAEMRVPVLMHFQEGGFNSGIARFPALLKAYPRTVFIGHANSFWAHVSAEVDDKVGYPTGKIQPGGLTDKILADYPNIYGDLSANSGRNALARDPEFAGKFLERHRAKLVFGSDCPCRDGLGAGQVGSLQGKCIARETLGMMTRMTSREIFHEIAWENGSKLLRI